MARKIGKVIVPTKPVSRATEVTGFTFKSYDKNAGVLRFEIKNQDGSPTDLLGATVRLFMYIYQEKEKKSSRFLKIKSLPKATCKELLSILLPTCCFLTKGKWMRTFTLNIRDGVHPTNDGYGQIAERMVAYLNSLV